MATLVEELQHPYLRALLRSTPDFGVEEGEPDLSGSAMPALSPLALDHWVAWYKRGCAPAGARAGERD